jgi:lysophospholipase L1-like esterase
MSSNSNIMSYPAFLQRHPGFHHYQGMTRTPTNVTCSIWAKTECSLTNRLLSSALNCAHPVIHASQHVTITLSCTLTSHHSQSVHSVLNFGSSGTCVIKGCKEGDRDYRLKKQYATAMSSQPHIVIVQFGTNDADAGCWDEKKFIADYCELISKFKALSSQPTVYVNIPTAVYVAQDDIVKSDEAEEQNRKRTNEFITRVNVLLPPIIRKIAALTNSTVIDLFTAMGGAQLKRRDAFDLDDMHLNDLGYLGVAHEIAYTLAEHENFALISRGRVDRR